MSAPRAGSSGRRPAERRRRVAGLVAVTAWSAPALVLAGAPSAIFLDGFEAGDACEWSAATLPVVAEGEMPTHRTNDELADAIPVSRCATVEGAIGSIQGGGGGSADFDFYRIDAAGPFLLRWTLEPRTELDDFVPYADLDDDEFLPIRGALPEVDSGASTRQIWIPFPGTWFVYVSDQRNWNRVNFTIVDPPVAENAEYRLRFEVERLAASSTGSLDHDPRSIGADGAVSVHAILASCLQISAETWAERLLPTSSPLDTRLFIVRPLDGGWQTIAENDDLPGLVLDSALSEVDVSAGLHYVIVDFVDSYIAPPALPADFELTVENGGPCP